MIVEWMEVRMMRKIDVDDEVYALLEAHAQGFDTPNDVLRRLLLGEGRDSGVSGQQAGGGRTAQGRRRTGKLKILIEKGSIKPGDQLVHHRPRKGDTLTGVVCEDGGVETEQGWFEAPSPALGGLTGSQIDGWACWTHQPSGKTLRTLRDESV